MWIRTPQVLYKCICFPYMCIFDNVLPLHHSNIYMYIYNTCIICMKYYIKGCSTKYVLLHLVNAVYLMPYTCINGSAWSDIALLVLSQQVYSTLSQSLEPMATQTLNKAKQPLIEGVLHKPYIYTTRLSIRLFSDRSFYSPLPGFRCYANGYIIDMILCIQGMINGSSSGLHKIWHFHCIPGIQYLQGKWHFRASTHSGLSSDAVSTAWCEYDSFTILIGLKGILMRNAGKR